MFETFVAEGIGRVLHPRSVVVSLLKWAIRHEQDRLLDPSCGDGGFIAGHRNAVGIEQDSQATQTAVSRAPWALVHEGDFFSWAAETAERFDCAAGNPPFIRSGSVGLRAIFDQALHALEKQGSKPPARLSLSQTRFKPLTAMTLEREVSGRPPASALCMKCRNSSIDGQGGQDCWLYGRRAPFLTLRLRDRPIGV